MKKLCGVVLAVLMVLSAAWAAAASGSCGPSAQWFYSAGVLTVTGSGIMKFSTYQEPPWRPYEKKIKTVRIEGGITSLDEYAFAWCDNLTSVTLPDSITLIDGFAFHKCKKLKPFKLPNKLKKIGTAAFYQCYALTSVKFPDSLQEFGNFAFSECNGLTSVTIPGNVTEPGWYTFAKCSNLQKVVISEGIEELGDAMFTNCGDQLTVRLPFTLKKMTSKWFPFAQKLIYNGTEADWYALNFDDPDDEPGLPEFTKVFLKQTTLNLPSATAYIHSGAFQNCKEDNVRISGSCRIESGAFSGPYLKNVYLPAAMKGTDLSGCFTNTRGTEIQFIYQ